MKKIFFGLAALMLSMTVLAERVSQEDAALVANNFMNVGNTASGVQKAPAKKMVLKKVATATENQYYIYENANGEGWVMIAADDAITPILAYSPTGKFVTENMPINARNWMSKYDKFIKKVVADGVVASDEAKTQWNQLRKGVRKATAAAVVGPLVQTKWDQDEPYNLYAPGTGTAGKNSDKAYTGCVATAMAQVLNYWQWPVQGNGSHKYQPQMDIYDENTGKYKETIVIYEGELEAKFGETTYDWANMKTKHTTSDTQAQKEAIGTLMFHCGVSVDMQYGGYEYDGSGAYTIDWGSESDPCAQNAFWKYFRYKKDGLTSYYRDGESGYYDSWSDADWTAMVKAELDKQHPIMYDGSGDGGHSFICDGYDNSSTPKFHFNWGWSGDNDGYYALNNLVPGSGGAGGGGYNFNETQAVIIGIVPDKPELPDQEVTWMANGEEFVKNTATSGLIVIPAGKPDACANGKIFVGWTETADYEHESDAPTYIKGGEVIEEAKTFYAVYATQEGEGTPVSTTTYTFNSKSWGDSQNAWNSDKDVNQYVSDKQGVQVTSGLSGAGATTKEALSNVSKVVVKYCTNASSGAGSITVKVGTASKVLEITKTSGTTLRDLEFAFDNASGKVSFEVTCTTNSIYINSVAITSGGGVNYSDYTTTCGAPAPKYAINITAAQNGSFATTPANEAAEGKTVTIKATPATHYHLASVTVKDASDATVAVSGEGNTRTFVMPAKAVTISGTFEQDDKVTIRFINNGEPISSADYFPGESAVAPADPTPACDKYTFEGWATAAVAEETETKPTLFNSFVVSTAQDYYAIYSRTEAGQGGEAAFDGTTGGTFKIYAQVGETKYYATGTVTSGKLESTTVEAEASEYTFEKVTDGFAIKISENTYLKYSGSSTNLGTQSTAYTWNIEAGTAGSWRVNATTGSNRALAFSSIGKFGGYSTGNIGKTVQDATYYDVEIGGGAPAATTYYSSVVTCGETAIDNNVVAPKAIKVLENGQIVIIFGDQKYTIFGQKIQ